MKCFAIALFFVVNSLEARNVTHCHSTFDCGLEYRSCCDGKCFDQWFCDGFCTLRKHCASNQYCVDNLCRNEKPDDHCDSETFCSDSHRCVDFRCVEYCNCGRDEECENDKCVRVKSIHYSPAAIVGFVLVVLIFACVTYASCIYKKRNARSSARQPHWQRPTPQSNEVSGETPRSQPIQPGGPPSYESLERVNELRPPSYSEIVGTSMHPNGGQSMSEGDIRPPAYQEAMQNPEINSNV